MMLSDELWFQLFWAGDSIQVRHKLYDPSCYHGTMQTGDISIMVWSVFTWYRLVLLVHLNKSLTGNCEIALLCN